MNTWEYCVVIFESIWISSVLRPSEDFENDIESYRPHGWVVHSRKGGARLERCRLRSIDNSEGIPQIFEHGDYFETITQLGLEGWEMVGTTYDSQIGGQNEKFRLFFKRQL